MVRPLSHLGPRVAALAHPAPPGVVAAASVALAAVALTCGALGVLLWGALPLGAFASVFSVGLVAATRSLGRAPEASGAGLMPRCFVGGAVAGFLNTFSSYVVLSAVQGRLPFGQAPLVQLALVTSAGLMVGMPLGMLFGTLYVIPIRATERRGATEADLAAALRSCGAWLLAVGSGSACVGLIEVWLWHNGHLERAWPLAFGYAPAILAGIAARALGRRQAVVAPPARSVAL